MLSPLLSWKIEIVQNSTYKCLTARKLFNLICNLNGPRHYQIGDWGFYLSNARREISPFFCGWGVKYKNLDFQLRHLSSFYWTLSIAAWEACQLCLQYKSISYISFWWFFLSWFLGFLDKTFTLKAQIFRVNIKEIRQWKIGFNKWNKMEDRNSESVATIFSALSHFLLTYNVLIIKSINLRNVQPSLPTAHGQEGQIWKVNSSEKKMATLKLPYCIITCVHTFTNFKHIHSIRKKNGNT